VPTHDVSELIGWNLPYPQFYIQDILPKEGVMLVYGDPKIKKSWLVQHIAYSLATGDEWLGFGTEQARVLLANFEISYIAYAWRLKDMARNFNLQPQMLYETTHMLWYLEEEEKFNRFRAEIRETLPNVIIIDCLAASYGGDENSGQQMADWIRRVSELRAENNSSPIVVHHTNKNMLTASSVDRARGHSRLAGWVDTLLFMAPQPSGIQLQFKARQATRELPNLNVRFSNYNWELRRAGGGANVEQD